MQPLTTEGESVVDILGLRVAYGGSVVLDGVELRLGKGDRVALVGASGSGKTTLARSLAALLPGARVTAKRLHVAGIDVLAAPAADLRRLRGGGVGFAFQDALATLDPLQRIGRALQAVRMAHGQDPAPEAMAALLAEVELPDPTRILRAFPHELSGGQRQRVGLALALAGRPRLLVADEPTSALDPPLARSLARLLVRLCAAADAPALLLVSHDLLLVQATCTRALVLDRGQVVESGPVAALVASPRHAVTAGLVSAAGATP